MCKWIIWKRRSYRCMSESAAHFLWLPRGFRCLSQFSYTHISVMSLACNVSIIVCSNFQMGKHIYSHLPTNTQWFGVFVLVLVFHFCLVFFFLSLIGVAKHHLVLISILTDKITNCQEWSSIKMSTSAVQTDHHCVPWLNIMCISVLQIWVFVGFFYEITFMKGICSLT